jgi:PilZ domain
LVEVCLAKNYSINLLVEIFVFALRVDANFLLRRPGHSQNFRSLSRQEAACILSQSRMKDVSWRRRSQILYREEQRNCRVALMERRQHERYGLEAPLSFSWKSPGNVSRRSEGLLINISGGGIFVATTDLPPEGARIRLSVSLRTVLVGTHLAIRASAELVRVGFCPSVGSTGFAAAIKTLTLRSNVKAIKDHATDKMVPAKRKEDAKTRRKSRPRCHSN